MAFLRLLPLFFLAAMLGTSGPLAVAQSVPLGGFIPYVGIGLTDEFASGDGLDATFFVAKPEDSLVGSPLTGTSGLYHDIALLDTGAATHILTAEASGSAGFNIAGNQFDGTNQQVIGGATGQILLDINDPHAIFATGLGQRTSAGASLQLDTTTFRGQSSVATLSAPTAWELPNILGLPMAAQHAISIRNDQPQVFDLHGRTVRTPEVEFLPLGSGSQQGITRRLNMKIKPGAAFVQGPLYVQDVTGILTGQPFHENPLSPTVVENAGLFVDVDFFDGAFELQDTEFLFDTGADLTVLSEQTAVRLGFDPILDTPDFVLQVEGSGGVSDGIPGFYVDQLRLDTVGGGFVVHNVPVAVLDVTNPNDPGNIVPGILGTNVFNGRNLVIDANASIGQGGTGPSLFISDPLTQQHVWAVEGQGDWATTTSWDAAGTPDLLWEVRIESPGAGPQRSDILQDHAVSRVTVAGSDQAPMTLWVGPAAGGPGPELTVVHDLQIDQYGVVQLTSQASINAAAINIQGGTLAGEGDIFVGNGPVHGAVRNLTGRVAPSGVLSIDGDLANLADGTLAFELGGPTTQIQADRFAFLAGTLEVTLADQYTPQLNDTFTLLTAAEGVSGQFDNLDLPLGYLWDVSYNASSVVLQLTGVGLQGDYNGDLVVNAQDYAVWREGLGTTYTHQHFDIWLQNYGTQALGGTTPNNSVPSPDSFALLGVTLVGLMTSARRRSLARIQG